MAAPNEQAGHGAVQVEMVELDLDAVPYGGESVLDSLSPIRSSPHRNSQSQDPATEASLVALLPPPPPPAAAAPPPGAGRDNLYSQPGAGDEAERRQISMFAVQVLFAVGLVFLTASIALSITYRSATTALEDAESDSVLALDVYLDGSIAGIRNNLAGRTRLFEKQVRSANIAQVDAAIVAASNVRVPSFSGLYEDGSGILTQPTRATSSAEWLALDAGNTWTADTEGFPSALHRTILAAAFDAGGAIGFFAFDTGHLFAVEPLESLANGTGVVRFTYPVQFADELLDPTSCQLPEEPFLPPSVFSYPPPQPTCPQAKVSWATYSCNTTVQLGLAGDGTTARLRNPGIPVCSTPSVLVLSGPFAFNGHASEPVALAFESVLSDAAASRVVVGDFEGITTLSVGVGTAVGDSFGVVYQGTSPDVWNAALAVEAQGLSSETVIVAVTTSDSDLATTKADVIVFSSDAAGFSPVTASLQQPHQAANSPLVQAAGRHLLAQYGSYQAVPDIGYREALVSDPSVIGCPLTASTTDAEIDDCILITTSQLDFKGTPYFLVISATPFRPLGGVIFNSAVTANANVRTTFARAGDDVDLAFGLACAIVFGFLLLMLVIVSVISRHVTEPIRRLQRDIRKVARLEVEDPYLFQQTRILELQDIQTVYQSMKQGIHSFSKFVPAPVVKQIISGDARASELYFAKRPVTVMFTDIRGFTSISEKLPPERLMVLLEEYLTSMLKCIEATNGTVGDFIGDGILVFWNSPEAVADHAAKACECALAMHAALKELNPGWRAAGFPDVMCRVGISSGTVLSGNIGSPHKMKFGVVGDTVNLASRVENLNKRYETVRLVTESTRGMLEGRFAFRPVDRVVVKGREASTTLYELLGEAEPAAGMVASSERLFELYLAQDFAGVEAAGREHLQRYGQDDGPVVALMARSRHLVAHPPEGAWDGTTVMASK